MSNKIILGTVQFGLDYGINNTSGKMSKEEVFKILDLAYASNLTVLDTAAAYGNSEERIGDYLSINKEKNFRIITKFNLKQNLTPIHSLEKSLHNLKIDQVDAVMFHSFEDFKSTKKEEINSLLELKGKKYKKLGISLYTNAQMKEIAEKEIFDLVQVPFNVLDNEQQRGEILKELKSKNLEIHTRSVFLQGLFFMKKDRIPLKLNPLVRYLNDL
nr:aldo/keto reductase [Algoriphagus sp.]